MINKKIVTQFLRWLHHSKKYPQIKLHLMTPSSCDKGPEIKADLSEQTLETLRMLKGK